VKIEYCWRCESMGYA